MKTAVCFVGIFTLMVFTGCGETKWVSRDFKNVESGIDTISILFPSVEYSIKSGEAKKVKAPHSRFISGKVAEVFKALIDSGEFISKSAVIVPDSITEAEWLSGAYMGSLAFNRRLSDSLLKIQSDTRSIPISPDLQEMVDRVPTRYFLYITGAAFGTTEDSKLNDMMQSQTFNLFYDHPLSHESQWNGLRIQLFLVDKTTNEILWCNASDPRDTVYDPGKDEEIEALCRKLLQAA